MGEHAYINLCQRILDEGEESDDRTGTGTLVLFGTNLEFDLTNSIPVLTTKKVNHELVIKELLWFISGSTDASDLSIWKGNTTREFLDNRGLNHLPEGDIGAGYGFQWRHFGANYKDMNTDYTNQGADQIKDIINQIKTNPDSRRIVMSAWNPADLDKMALPPCHMFCQFNVSKKRKELSCLLYMRSADVFLGLPFNILSYSVLTYLIAHICGLKPKRLIVVMGNTHIYKNHIEQVKQQLSRGTYKFPKLLIKKNSSNIDDYKLHDFEVVDYKHHPYIKATMAV